MFRCEGCGESKSECEFYLQPSVLRGHTVKCKECIKRYSRNRARPNNKQDNRSWRLRSSYGLTQIDYDRMVADQSGKCAICQRVCSELHIDHCHDTGVVRGLLCTDCNRGIGMLKHDPEIFMSAIKYLKVERPVNLTQLLLRMSR